MLERVQRKATDLGKGLEHKCWEKPPRELGVFGVGRRKFTGDLITLYTFLKGGCSHESG